MARRTEMTESSSAGTRSWPTFAKRILLPALLLLSWYAFTRYGEISPFILPDPLTVFRELFAMLKTGEVLTNTVISLKRSLCGFFLGGLLGVSSGILIGWSRFWDESSDLLINFVRSVPKTALAPLFIVWFGLGDLSKILLIGFSSYFFTVIPTIEGVKNVDRSYIKAARSLGANQWQIMKTVILPAALPSIFAGIRLSVTTSLLVLVMVEIIAGNSGLGYLLEEARGNLNMAAMFAVLFTLGLLGYGLDAAAQYLGKIMMPWRRGKTISN